LLVRPQLSELEYDSLIRRLSNLAGVDLRKYKRDQLRRRLLNEMTRRQITTAAELLALFSSAESSAASLVSSLTINVTEANRDPARFRELYERAIKPLANLGRSLKVWSAGCSYGAEPVTLALYLAQTAPLERFSILATDIDPIILEQACLLRFVQRDLKNLPPEWIEEWFQPDDKGWRLADKLGRNLRFQKHNLIGDDYPTRLDLIVFRNVAIYFEQETTREVHRKMAGSLKPGGFLFLGATERVISPETYGLNAVAPFLYQKA
jgi:chemotaxis protein methyltransferase CheR